MDEDEDDDEADYGVAKKTPLSKLRRRESLSPDSINGDGAASENEEGLEGWGTSKKDYYNADDIESEGDALEEEEEAMRLQQKKLESMADADFGFDESEWLAAGEEEDDDSNEKTVTEVLPEIQVSDAMPQEEKLKIMKLRYPEFEPLFKDFTDLQPLHKELSAAAEIAWDRVDEEDERPPVSVLKFRALTTYLAAISMYLVILTSPARKADGNCLSIAPGELRNHQIMSVLVSCRKQWDETKVLSEPDISPSAQASESESDVAEKVAVPKKVSAAKKSRLEAPASVQRKTKAQKALEKAHAAAENQRTERLNKTELGLQELSNLLEQDNTAKHKFSRKVSQLDDDDSDFGDETSLTAYEAAEKAKKKKSLRFYTSQIAQKSNKRGNAGRDAGGDTDLPYRERMKDRQDRLNTQAQKRGRQEANEDERLGDDSDEDDRRMARQVRGEVDGNNSDDYYDMVASRTNDKKANKKKLAEAQAEAAREGGRVEVQEEIGPDGKRAITYAIEKNKGLAPKRNKDVRNPRVKKRKKFEAKKKKLGSMKAIYKGGESRGGYGGEMTGIKRNLVKSVKL